jgi:hypothetical protein
MSPVTRLAYLLLPVFVLLTLLLVGASPAEEPAEPHNSTKSEKFTQPQPRSLLQRLLTWPEKEKETDKEGDKEGGQEEEEEPLESDRPDFTECSTTVGYRRLQIESGYTFTHGIGGDPTDNKHDLPELLLRYGVAERLELRLAWDEGMVFESQRDRNTGRLVTQAGSTDLQFGLKYALTQQDHWRPQSAIIVAATAPVGSPFQTSRQVDVYVNYCYSWEFNKKASLNCSTGNLWTAAPGDRYSEFFQSGSLDYELTKKLHAYNEWYVLLPSGSNDNRPQHYDDAGLTYLVTPNFQLDWRVGVGLSPAADRFFTGFGFAWRW